MLVRVLLSNSLCCIHQSLAKTWGTSFFFPPGLRAQQPSSSGITTPHSVCSTQFLHLHTSHLAHLPSLERDSCCQLEGKKSWEGKRLSFLCHSISVQQWQMCRDTCPLIQAANIKGPPEDAVSVKRLNLALWAWPGYMHLSMVHLSEKESRGKKYFNFSVQGNLPQCFQILCPRHSSNPKMVPMGRGRLFGWQQLWEVSPRSLGKSLVWIFGWWPLP